MTFYQIIKKVIEHEGGYVNDPKDAGGETKYGILKDGILKLILKISLWTMLSISIMMIIGSHLKQMIYQKK